MATIGGLLLLLGAYFVFKGKMYQASMIYMSADICWFGISIKTQDYFGAFLILLGFILGFLVFLKMHYGIFHKELNKNQTI